MALKPRNRVDADKITAAALGQSVNHVRENLTPSSSRGFSALDTARKVAPRLPPAEVDVKDQTVNHNMRVRKTTLRALGRAAEKQNITVKQLIMRAVADSGVDVAEADLRNGAIRPWKDRDDF
ncbi:hypothetical protein A0U90_13920 (plasmid) [Kozakia baliensis]|nr:hypothetical protein A0U90_13920 [Kozakia baliensis]